LKKQDQSYINSAPLFTKVATEETYET